MDINLGRESRKTRLVLKLIVRVFISLGVVFCVCVLCILKYWFVVFSLGIGVWMVGFWVVGTGF